VSEADTSRGRWFRGSPADLGNAAPCPITVHEPIPPPEPDAWRDPDGGVWFNLRRHPEAHPGVYDAEPDCTPLFLGVTSDGGAA